MSPSLTRRSALIGLSAVSFAFTTSPAFAAYSAPKRTIFLAGDSTAARKAPENAPETGWGMALPYYATPRIAIANHARDGHSSKSFVDHGHLNALLNVICAGDLLIVQFAHNDEKTFDPGRYTEPWTTYQEHLRMYIDGARSRRATPVLATPAERRRFDESGRAFRTHGEYPAAMRALARVEGVALIDVQDESFALWQRLGPAETKNYFLWTDDGRRDDTHFARPGASAIARMIANGLLDVDPLPAGDLRRLDEEPPSSWFTWSADRSDTSEATRRADADHRGRPDRRVQDEPGPESSPRG